MSATIAVVDDDLAISKVLGDLLTDEGYQMVCYSDSASFFDGLAQHIPALLILDLHLEHFSSGWEILAELRSRPTTSALPIMVSTTDAFLPQEHRDELQALQATMIEKPFDIETMLAMVTQVLAKQ